MKKLITLIIVALFFISQAGYTQKKSIFLLGDFTQGIVLMKNGAKTNALLNYDASNRKMKFKQQEETMILTNTQEIDSIFIASHKFIPYNRSFLEVIEMPNGNLYINWSLRELYKGKPGAYGYANQSTTTTSINTSYYNKSYYKVENPDIMEQINGNDYWLFRNDKPVKFRNEKSLLKLFPSKEEMIKGYIKKHNVNMKNPQQVIELTDFCLGL
ncbi:hypothetical protein [Parabacteroides gordonii]|jgi:hypothetical protein|uniref:hypothetical protein n=1 Tax=Parabacteroides gordonii TaxID=574930 RepID=UPI00241C6530|nr:hypothetical protein [Parabacteroides gordonii]